jgi:peroxiredoxin
MLALGSKAPEFSLPNVDGRVVGLNDVAAARGYLVMFLCNHCPYVKHIQKELTAVAHDFAERGGAVFAINSNDPANYPDDSPEKMVIEARSAGYRFPYLFDASQEIAKAYQAACTPDFFLFDSNQSLVYRGQFDGSRPRNGVSVTGRDLKSAIEALLAGRKIPEQDQIPSVGCNIKWRPGNEPGYFSRR